MKIFKESHTATCKSFLSVEVENTVNDIEIGNLADNKKTEVSNKIDVYKIFIFKLQLRIFFVVK